MTEADLGVPFYPGAKLVSGSLASSPDGSQAVAQQQTSDPPEKVLAFYRERLKAQSAGRELADSGSSDSNGNSMLELSAEVGKPGIQVVATGSHDGTSFSISSSCIVK